MLKGVVVGEEKAAAGESGGAKLAGVTGMLWVPKCLSLALGVLVTGCFPRCFMWDFLHLLLCAFKTVAFEGSPGIAQACISVTASSLQASHLLPLAQSQNPQFSCWLSGVVPAPPQDAK